MSKRNDLEAFSSFLEKYLTLKHTNYRECMTHAVSVNMTNANGVEVSCSACRICSLYCLLFSLLFALHDLQSSWLTFCGWAENPGTSKNATWTLTKNHTH